MSFLLLMALLSSLRISDDLLLTMERIRHIRLESSLKVEWKTKKAFQHYLQEKIQEEFPEKKQKVWEAFLKALGLMPQSTDLSAILLKLYSSYAAGLYDPELKTMFLIQGFGLPENLRFMKEFFGNFLPSSVADFFLAHEIVHALQDQQFNLQRYLPKLLSTDQKLARMAVVEGDATLMQFFYLLEKLGLQEASLDAWTKNLALSMESLSLEPFHENSFFLSVMLFPYTHGLPFVTRAYQEKGMDGLDRLYTQPPLSTEQILHPEKYPDELPLPMADWEPPKEAFEADTLGEFFIRNYFQFKKLKDATELAEGWANDRVYLFTSPFAFAWKTVWDSPSEAKEFADGLKRFLPEEKIFQSNQKVCLYHNLPAASLSSFQRYCKKK